MKAQNIILFDGDCNFCDQSVQFIINRDPKGHFKFASLQSDIGQQLLAQYDIPQDTDSFILITPNKAFAKSTAALHVFKRLNRFWKLLFPFIIIPPPIRNIVYNIVAKNRYKWFGKKEHCMIPSPEVRERFL